MLFNRRTLLYLLLAVVFAGLAVFAFAQGGVNITATNNDTLVVDQNGDGLADPGDVVEYNVTIRNCGPDTALDGNYTSDIDPNTNLIPGSVQVGAPVGTDLVNCGVSDGGNPPSPEPIPSATPIPPVNADALDDTFSVTNGSTNTGDVLTNDLGEAPLTVLSFWRSSNRERWRYTRRRCYDVCSTVRYGLYIGCYRHPQHGCQRYIRHQYRYNLL